MYLLQMTSLRLEVLLFETLTGKRPYHDVESVVVERPFEDHVFPSLNDIDSDFARIIAKCWNERHSTVEEIQRDFPVKPGFNGKDERGRSVSKAQDTGLVLWWRNWVIMGI